MTISIVGFKDFDLGVYLTLGAELISYEIDGTVRNAYAVDLRNRDDFPLKVTTNIPNLDGKIPVFFMTPEDVYQEYILPCFVVRSNEPAPAYDRNPAWGWRRKPSNDAKLVSIKKGNIIINGYDKYDVAWQDIPFNLSYDVQVMARSRNNGITMLQWALRRLRPPYFSTMVYDSNGDKRLYDSGPVSVSNMSELADISDRMSAWTVNFEIQGGISLVPQASYGSKMNIGSNGEIFMPYPSETTNFVGLEVYKIRIGDVR